MTRSGWDPGVGHWVDALPPLVDPDYEPTHPPVDGKIPDVVAKYGPRTQMRWFQRHWDDLAREVKTYRVLGDYYYASTQHTGGCCLSCAEDHEVFEDGECCCYALKAGEAIR